MALKLIHGSKKLAGHSIAVFADLFSKSSYAFWEKVVSYWKKGRNLRLGRVYMKNCRVLIKIERRESVCWFQFCNFAASIK